MESLSYRHDDDRCYGATGMAIGLFFFDGEDFLEEINVDADSHEVVTLSNSFYFAGSPSVSAKTSWNKLLNSFNLMTAMVISNALCRSLVLDGMPVRFEIKQSLHDVIAEEATQTCSLDFDELERLFDKNYNTLHRVFNHQGVQSIARDLATHLKHARRLSRGEVLEILQALSTL